MNIFERRFFCSHGVFSHRNIWTGFFVCLAYHLIHYCGFKMYFIRSTITIVGFIFTRTLTADGDHEIITTHYTV